jgi:hypothetical protein
MYANILILLRKKILPLFFGSLLLIASQYRVKNALLQAKFAELDSVTPALIGVKSKFQLDTSINKLPELTLEELQMSLRNFGGLGMSLPAGSLHLRGGGGPGTPPRPSAPSRPVSNYSADWSRNPNPDKPPLPSKPLPGVPSQPGILI